ncbi:MAG TPA: CBS domain-containing protein [Thermodesulfobacteriota bacterium]|nr:CBS domain-containing protein [Thermodesulfobacteriota bacterium]
MKTKAKDLMTRPVMSARRNASARDIALQLLNGFYSGMPVTDDDGKVIGMVTEFDILNQLHKGKELTRINAGDIMVKNVLTVDVNTPVEEVMKVMLDKDVIRVPVTEKERLVGVIARCDILKSYMEPEFVSYM